MQSVEPIRKTPDRYAERSESWIAQLLKEAKSLDDLVAEVDATALADCPFGVVYGIQVMARASESVERIESYRRQMLMALLGPVRRDKVA